MTQYTQNKKSLNAKSNIYQFLIIYINNILILRMYTNNFVDHF